jgi:hypothetical protein
MYNKMATSGFQHHPVGLFGQSGQTAAGPGITSGGISHYEIASITVVSVF